MPLQYISEDELKIDEIVENLLVQGEDLERYYIMCNREVESICNEKGVLTADIPVDGGTGYVTSATLRQCAVFYCLWAINNGYSGVGEGNRGDDVYAHGAKIWYQLYKDKEDKITKEVITGDDGTAIINPQDRIRQVFYTL